MEFRLLGPVELWSSGHEIDLGTNKIRLMLAVLLLEAGHTVAFETLVRRVWGDSRPPKVAASVQANLSRLRARLEAAGGERVNLEHTPSGYRLQVAAEDVDALEFTRTIIEAQAAAGDNAERERVIRLLQTAEAMVRGEPLTGLPGEWARNARVGLMERHRSAMVTRLTLQLERDHPQTLISELRELSSRHPLDESIAGLLMQALYTAGRRADALAVFQGIRRRLREHLGIEPHRALQETHQRILQGGDFAARHAAPVLLSPPPDPVPNTLERDPPGFVGRAQDLAALREQITAVIGAGHSAICVIDGMPGVGKTTLALRLAHELQTLCPDGALQLNLRSHDLHRAPTAADEALRLLLHTLAVEPGELQQSTTLDQALTSWRRQTHGKRLLLLLDDVGDVEQIRPLLPGGSGSIVLVTCRRQLTDLSGAIRHTLALMNTADARALFLNTAASEATQELSAVDTVVRACGHLPLAVSIAGALLRGRAAWTATDFAERFARALTTYGLDGLNERLDATFETSYRDLPELPRQVLRRIALHPSPRISPYFAAALADTDLFDAEFALDALVRHHLLAEPERHQFQQHDLVRIFAHRALARDEQSTDHCAARDRLIDFAVLAVDRATLRFHPYRHVNLARVVRAGMAIPDFATAQQAAAWLDQEQESLRLLVLEALDNGRGRQAGALAHMLATYLDRRCLWQDAVVLHEKALHTWVRLEDAMGQAYALGDLATAMWRLGNLDQAQYWGEIARGIWERLRDIDGQADAWLLLGRTHHYSHKPAEAIRCYGEAALLRSRRGDNHGESQALYHLGVVRFDAGDHEAGISDTRRALSLAQEVCDEVIERNCLNNLGEFHRQRGDYSEALECYQRAMALAERVGDPRNIAVAALNVGEISRLTGRPADALQHLDAALDAFTRLNTRDSMVNTLLSKVRAHVQLHENDQAAACLAQATAMAGPSPDPLLAARVHLTGGALYAWRREYSAALAEYRSALARARQARALLERAEAHRGLGDVVAASGAQLSAAKSHWRKALALYEPLQAREADAIRKRLRTLKPPGRIPTA